MNSSTTTRTIMVIQHNEFVLRVGERLTPSVLAALVKSRGLILWDNEGVWGLLTRTHLQELLRRWEAVQAHRTTYPMSKLIEAEMTFTNTIQVTSEIARALRLNS